MNHDQIIIITYSKFPAITETNSANHVPEILQPHHFINTSLPTQSVVTSLNTSAKSKSIWQTSLSKLNNHFGKVQVTEINYRAKPIPNIPQTPKLP